MVITLGQQYNVGEKPTVILLLNVFFAAILLVPLERFGEDADILADLAHY